MLYSKMYTSASDITVQQLLYELFQYDDNVANGYSYFKK